MDKFIVIDIETTGHSPSKKDKVIEVGIVTIENNKITKDYTTLLNPEMEIPPFISNLTGITDEDVEDAPTFIQKGNEIVDFFKDGYLIAHNVPFDLVFLNEELAQNGMKKLSNLVLDTVELSRVFYPQAPGYKLGQLAEYLHIIHEEPHRALSDAYVTAKLFLKLKSKLESLPYETITHLLNLEEAFNSDLYQFLYNRQQTLAFSTTVDSNLVSYRGLAFKKLESTVAEPNPNPISFGDYLDDIYEVDGTMGKEIKRYEKRDGQREMSEGIYDSFQLKKHALIEAETGTGKSLAYLIPAIYEAIFHHERIIVSTYTTQLQSQLLEEEIPLIQKLIPFPFRVALLKGKHHYISLERFEKELASDQKDNYDIVLTKAIILVWLTETSTGDIDEIQLPSSGYYFYKSISTESEGNVDPSSPWFAWSYYQKAREKAQKANLIITNHALLCTDAFNDYNFLPTYDKAIIDEAHHLELTASRHYGLKLDYVNMQYTLNQLGTIDDGNWLSGIILNYPLEKHELVSLQKWDEVFFQTKHEVDDLFSTLFQYVIDQKGKNKPISDTGRTQYRFDENKEDNDKWKIIKKMATRLTFYFRDLIHILSLLDQYLNKYKIMDKYAQDDLNGNIQQLQTFIDHIEQIFLVNGVTSLVKWMEIENNGAKNAVFLYCEPTDVSTLLATHFFAKKQSIILTSATLTMKSSFSFIQNRLGLSTDDVVTYKIDSPFSYHDQVQLMIPNDFPDISQNHLLEEFIYSTCEAIISLAKVTKGRMLVLFTSYHMLRKSHEILKETMDINKYMLISQGISSGSRARLKKNFQSFDQSVLLGTSSFWEGVDIPGDDLSCLVIVRLPFQPPNHPIYEAKAAELKKEKKSAFFELSLPNAVIRFKQGFGRLIRSTHDRGIVFVCDARIIKARYSKFFIESIPIIPITHDSTHALIKKAEDWF